MTNFHSDMYQEGGISTSDTATAGSWFQILMSMGRKKICRSQQMHQEDGISTSDHVYQSMIKDG